MKKVCVLILSVFTLPVFGSGIGASSASAPCTNTTLETYSGNTNLQADWAPNTINLRWYNNNTLMDVQSSSNTCVYDGTLTVPQTAPSRTGYTFDGWTVRPEMDFGTIVNEKGTQSWGKGLYGGKDYCWYAANSSATHKDCDAYNDYKELQQQEWKVKFEHGDLYGMGGCGTLLASVGQRSNSIGEIGQYCWCKATGYKTTNATTINGSLNVLSWVFEYNMGDINTCKRNCSGACIQGVISGAWFRTALFTPAN